MFSRLRRNATVAPKGTPPKRLPVISLLIVGVVGILVLLDMLTTDTTLNVFGALLLDYAVIIAAFALILGVVHLVRVHARRIRERGNGWQYSLFLLVVTLFFSVVGLIEGANGTITQWSVTTLLLPLQAAFFSLLAFFLVSVLYRTARLRSLESFLLVATALIVVVAGTPLGATFTPWLVTLKLWLMDSIATAGARAVLLGIGLGTLVTAFRFVADGRRLFK
jgi:hypothetical protein